MQLNNNIKLIRELSGLKQDQFARLIKTKLSNLKTYENSDVKPKANILASISEIAGISVKELEIKKLTHKDITINTELIGFINNENTSTGTNTKSVNALEEIVHGNLRIESMLRVMLRSQAEILAAQRNESVTKVLGELTKAVNDESGAAFSAL